MKNSWQNCPAVTTSKTLLHVKVLWDRVWHPLCVCTGYSCVVKICHVHLNLPRMAPAGWTGGWRHAQAHPQLDPHDFLLARGMPCLCPLLHLSSLRAKSEAVAATGCTLPDIAGWQPLGLLLYGQWVKSCSCLQWTRIWDSSPVLVCKHIYLSAVVSSVI